jgi:hypothetical protein
VRSESERPEYREKCKTNYKVANTPLVQTENNLRKLMISRADMPMITSILALTKTSRSHRGKYGKEITEKMQNERKNSLEQSKSYNISYTASKTITITRSNLSTGEQPIVGCERKGPLIVSDWYVSSLVIAQIAIQLSILSIYSCTTRWRPCPCAPMLIARIFVDEIFNFCACHELRNMFLAGFFTSSMINFHDAYRTIPVGGCLKIELLRYDIMPIVVALPSWS